jgi:hypothetical protein
MPLDQRYHYHRRRSAATNAHCDGAPAANATAAATASSATATATASCHAHGQRHRRPLHHIMRFMGFAQLAQALILIPNLKYFESRNFDKNPKVF